MIIISYIKAFAMSICFIDIFLIDIDKSIQKKEIFGLKIS